ncbi:MAG: regulatory protein RecX [Lachnospiraceae bacterium]|nr:regulatory protein RecX [Lachnospiraceae bacterium]
MKVTDVVKNKHNDKYSVFIDGDFAFSLAMGDIMFFKLEQGNDVSEKTYEYIKNEVMLIKAKNRAAAFLGASKKTEKAVYDKLSESGYPEDICEKVIEELKSYGYINDLDYALSYIEDRLKVNPRGVYGLKMELRQKGVKDSVIEKAIDMTEIDESIYIKQLMIKKRYDLQDMDEKEKKKLYDFLLRRGFSYGIIKDTIKNFDDI